jgi:hypothetical protein
LMHCVASGRFSDWQRAQITCRPFPQGLPMTAACFRHSARSLRPFGRRSLGAQVRLPRCIAQRVYTSEPLL